MMNIKVDFLSAGKATFTVCNPVGVRYTYRIKKPKNLDLHFVQLLTGPDNTKDYTYLGVYNPTTGQVRLTKKSAYNETALPVRVLRWAIKAVWTGYLPEGYSIQHSGTCGKCGRKLTVPESLDTGLGPECAEQLGISWEKTT